MPISPRPVLAPSAAAVRFAASVLALFLVVGAATGCARGRVHRLDPNPPPRLTEGEPEIFATTPERPWREIAIVMTTPRDGMEDDTLARHVREIKKAARRAGADAVINARLVTVKKSGYVADPNTPFPSAMQGEWAEYMMKGSAVVYVETDAEGQPMGETGEVPVDALDPPQEPEETFTEEIVEELPARGLEIEAGSAAETDDSADETPAEDMDQDSDNEDDAFDVDDLDDEPGSGND